MKKLLFLFLLTLSPMLASAQTASDVQYSGSSDYLPFVNMGKQWNVVSTVVNSNSSCHFERYSVIVRRISKYYEVRTIFL